jgi:hypothetical protein
MPCFHLILNHTNTWSGLLLVRCALSLLCAHATITPSFPSGSSHDIAGIMREMPTDGVWSDQQVWWAMRLLEFCWEIDANPPLFTLFQPADRTDKGRCWRMVYEVASWCDLSLSRANTRAMITPNFLFGSSHEIVGIMLRNSASPSLFTLFSRLACRREGDADGWCL